MGDVRRNTAGYSQRRDTILLSRPHARMPMPAFRCTACRHQFNRLTGTPLARLRHADRLPQFVRLLSCQISYKEAAEILEVDYSAIANWTEKFRRWLITLDPTGAWERRVRLGIKPRPLVVCPACGKDKSVRFFGFSEDGRARRLACRTCKITFQYSHDVAAGHLLESAIAHDPLVTRERHKRNR